MCPHSVVDNTRLTWSQGPFLALLFTLRNGSTGHHITDVHGLVWCSLAGRMEACLVLVTNALTAIHTFHVVSNILRVEHMHLLS